MIGEGLTMYLTEADGVALLLRRDAAAIALSARDDTSGISAVVRALART